jgi:hypothetical protein
VVTVSAYDPHYVCYRRTSINVCLRVYICVIMIPNPISAVSEPMCIHDYIPPSYLMDTDSCLSSPTDPSQPLRLHMKPCRVYSGAARSKRQPRHGLSSNAHITPRHSLGTVFLLVKSPNHVDIDPHPRFIPTKQIQASPYDYIRSPCRVYLGSARLKRQPRGDLSSTHIHMQILKTHIFTQKP